MEVTTRSPEETQAVGEMLGASLQPGDVVALIGDLGTGKTCLTHGIARGVGILTGQSVNSPSYVLINEYKASCPLYHIDLYRIRAPEQLADLGIEELLYGQGICVIEWADRALDWLPQDHLRVELYWVDEHTRKLIVSSVGPRFIPRLQRVRRQLGVER